MRTVAIVLTLVYAAAGFGQLRLEKQAVLSSLLSESRLTLGVARHRTLKIAFSPDGRYLAIAAGVHDTASGPVIHVAVLTTSDLAISFESTVAATSVRTLQWSTDGTYILVQSLQGSWLWSLATGTSCTVGDRSSEGAGFVSGGVFAVAQRMLSTTSFRFYDEQCRRVSDATIPFHAVSIDTASGAAGFVAATGDFGNIYVLRPPNWTVAVRIQEPHVDLHVVIFGGGEGVCTGPGSGPDDATFRCWNIQAEGPQLASYWTARKGGTAPVAAAKSVPLVVFLDSGYSYNAFTEQESSPFRRWIVWDAERGQIVATLPGHSQDFKVFRHTHSMPDAIALSDDGKHIGRAGSEVVEIFALPAVPASVMPR